MPQEIKQKEGRRLIKTKDITWHMTCSLMHDLARYVIASIVNKTARQPASVGVASLFTTFAYLQKDVVGPELRNFIFMHMKSESTMSDLQY